MPTVPCRECQQPFRSTTNAKHFCRFACYKAFAQRYALATIESRFWSKVNQKGPSDCWLWTAATLRGYGQFTYRPAGAPQRHVYAHRFAWTLIHGDIPEGQVICHRCDRPLCVNPDHLFCGTQFENLDDARQKGRLIDGLHLRKLSDAAYREILAAREPGRRLAHKFGVTPTTISRIQHRRQGSTFWRGATLPDRAIGATRRRTA